jgi:type II restriction/modification system DNA methylase subunit YeeA
LSDIERRIKEKIEAVGVPLKKWDIKINRGILTGCNEAFIIDGATKDRLIAEDPKSAEIIRPILRGRDIKRYSYDFKDRWLIASHNGYTDDADRRIPPINIERYPAIKAHLDQFWDVISVRTDKGVTPYNLRNCAYMDDFSEQKIVWAELARTGNAFALDSNGSVVLNTAYIMVAPHLTIDQLNNMLIILNSRCILYYLNLITSKFDATGWRWLKQFVEQLPIPLPSATTFKESADVMADQLVYEVYGLTASEVSYIENLKFKR